LALRKEGLPAAQQVWAISQAQKKLSEKRKKLSLNILITAGPTREAIDPVRFISNRSTGAMGEAIAKAARKSGHKVILIGPGENLSAQEMRKKVLKNFAAAGAVIMAAAVADYRPEKQSGRKIKKSRAKLTLKLVKTPDILFEVGHKKGNRIVVGFALETENLRRNAEEKLKKKNLDFIVANRLTKGQDVFGRNKTSVLIIDKNGGKKLLKNVTKDKVAKEIVRKIEDIKNTNTAW
jgi:phosphopantothenoylcysteine decarboxylase/phosphopantothenate--cysteine ligase